MDLYLNIKLTYIRYFLNIFFTPVKNQTLANYLKKQLIPVNKFDITLQLLDLIKRILTYSIPQTFD